MENQKARYEDLSEALNFSKIRLNDLLNDVNDMETDLNVRRKRSVSSVTTYKCNKKIKETLYTHY